MTKKKQQRKKTKRSKVENPALNKQYNSKIRNEYLDYDYIDKLSEEEKKWLNDFTEEYLNASVGSQKEAFKNRFHNTPEMVKDCTDRNNSRNRCVYSKAVATETILRYDYNTIHELIEEKENKVNPEYMEDALIEFIDSKNITDPEDDE